MHRWTETRVSDNPPMIRHVCLLCGISFTLETEKSIEAVSAKWPCVSGVEVAEPPGMLRRAVHYASAVGKWVVSGMPRRTEAQIERIFEVCRECEQYDSEAKICRKCGCLANRSQNAWRNKIAMRTERCPLKKWGYAMPFDALFSTIERVYLINLRRRPDRLRTFFQCLKAHGWPFPDPIIYPAIEGDKVGIPPEFTQGGGAYGCRMSHLRILQDCLMEGVQSVLILEDDAEIQEGFPELAAEFFAKVPSDWEGIMLGGQHHTPPLTTGTPGVVRVQNAQRTHAYIARPSYMKALQKRWGNATVHIDWLMRDWQHQYVVYAPDPWLVGQAGGRSDIRAAIKPKEWWQRNHQPAVQESQQTLIFLRAPRSVMEELQELGWHGGYSRDKKTGIDQALLKIATEARRKYVIQDWLRAVLPECSVASLIPTLWHPDLTLRDVQQAYTGPIVEIMADTVEEAESKLPAECRETLEAFFHGGTPVLFLGAPDEVIVEMERNGGWLFVSAEADLKAASRKARKEGKVVTIRGRAASCLLPTVEIEAKSYEELIEKWIA